MVRGQGSSRPRAAPTVGGGPGEPTCTVVIVTRDRPTEVERCLRALERQDRTDFDVLVVDNAPATSETRELASRWGARYARERRPGLSRGRNLAARTGRSEVLAFLDDDSVPEARWLSTLLPEFDDPHVMAVAGGVRPLTVETEVERLCASAGYYDFGSKRLVLDGNSSDWFETANFGGLGIGANMAFRRRAFGLWPGFCERLGRGAPLGGGEEHHAYFQLIKRGYRVVLRPDAVVGHPCPRTKRELRGSHLRDIAHGAGYLTLLLVEEPAYRRRVVKFALEAIRGERRAWRPHPVPRGTLFGSRRGVWAARLLGPLLYASSRLRSPPGRGTGRAQ